MSVTSAIARHYEYNPRAYSGVLNKIHNKVKSNLEKTQLASNAWELQTLLQEIKQTARLIGQEPLSTVEAQLVKDYEDLIISMINIENQARVEAKANLGKRMSTTLAKEALFNRRTKTHTIPNVDNIFEEELAALMAAIEKKLTGSTDIYKYTAGTGSADVAAMTDKDMSADLERKVISELQKTADALGKTLNAKKLLKARSQKIDDRGFHEDLSVGLDINSNKIAKLAYYLKDATFSAKQYSTWSKGGNRDFSEVQLHLGNTILYKSITGVVSEVYNNPNVQRSIFFRGLQILKYTTNPPSATPAEVAKHFTHMRFNYELRGTGLLNGAGESQIAKYIIYNDPRGESIFVRDTASLILEELEKDRSNLFGEITIAASRVRSSNPNQ